MQQREGGVMGMGMGMGKLHEDEWLNGVGKKHWRKRSMVMTGKE